MKSLLALILLFTVSILSSCVDSQGVTGLPYGLEPDEFIHKDHNYIRFGVGYGQTIVHDPDCHCLQKESNSREL